MGALLLRLPASPASHHFCSSSAAETRCEFSALCASALAIEVVGSDSSIWDGNGRGAMTLQRCIGSDRGFPLGGNGAASVEGVSWPPPLVSSSLVSLTGAGRQCFLYSHMTVPAIEVRTVVVTPRIAIVLSSEMCILTSGGSLTLPRLNWKAERTKEKRGVAKGLKDLNDRRGEEDEGIHNYLWFTCLARIVKILARGRNYFTRLKT